MDGLSDGSIYDVAVVGGGINGLLVAIVLAANNNKVILIEKSDKLGGLFLASPFKKVGMLPYFLRSLSFFDGILPNEFGGYVEKLSQAYILDGGTENLGGSIEGFERFLKTKFPSDVDDIGRFVQDVKRYALEASGMLVSGNGSSLAALGSVFQRILETDATTSLGSYLQKNIKNKKIHDYMKKDMAFLGVGLEKIPFSLYALNMIINDGDLEFNNVGAEYILAAIVEKVESLCVVKRSVKVSRLQAKDGVLNGVVCIDGAGNRFIINASRVVSTVSAFDTSTKLVIDNIDTENFDINNFNNAISDSCFYKVSYKLKSSIFDLGLVPGYNVVYLKKEEFLYRVAIKERPEKFLGIDLADQIVIKVTKDGPMDIEVFVCCFSRVAADNFDEYFINNFKNEVNQDLLQLLDKAVPGLRHLVESCVFLELAPPDVDSARVFNTNPKNYGASLSELELTPEDYIKRNLQMDYKKDLQVANIAQDVYGFPLTKERFSSQLVRIETELKNLYYCGQDVFGLGLSGSVLGVLMFCLFLVYGYSSAQVNEEINQLIKGAMRDNRG